MDGPGISITDAEFGDRRTYGEVVLTEVGGDTALALSDWRRGNDPVGRSIIRPRLPKLYRRARPGSLEQERKRAREVVDVAKQAVADTFNAVRFGNRIDVDRLVPIVDAISASITRNPHAIPSITRLKLRSEYTYLHSVAVCGLMVGLAKELRLDPATSALAGLAGLLHDIGKAVVPKMLIEKPGPLTDEEFDFVKLHPQRGYELLSDADTIPEDVRQVVLHHHERMDGRGYPHGVPAANQSILVRMGTICDVYDAVTSARSYKASWSPGEAIEWMRSTTGHFDPRLLMAFIKMLGAFLPGTLVRLRSERLAVVVEDPDGDPLNPAVVSFYCALYHRPLPRQRLLSARDPIVAVESPVAWHFIDWPAMRDDLMGRTVGENAAADAA